VIAEQVESAMLGGGTRRLDTAVAEQAAEPARRLLRLDRDITAEIQRLREQYDETRRELRLDPRNIEAVVRVALEVAGQPPLRPGPISGTFVLPPLAGAWSRASEGLEHPHTREIRPLTFDSSIATDDRVVLAHLNHRLVQMCLRLLRAEVWASTDTARLSRVTARLVDDPGLHNPVVAVHARLLVTGAGGTRLHEEVITAAGELREGRFARLNVGQTATALAAATADSPSPAMLERLAEQYPRHRDALRSAIEARMRERTDGLRRRLEERRDREISDLTAVLQELRARILDELSEPEPEQLNLFSPSQREQFSRDLDSLRRRAEHIPEEIDREAAAIRERFAEPTPRIFPIAITYLVPRALGQAR
jgi:hypothetical protein